ncbi:TetR/AcrR family transcriptional regulator [Parvibaculaceae bacterium PLY_AMNH_Bact1]|nr:TetR/AcrR family transcriptional regulator [Parvibaculaceae bacterium PLY_AMNH_Bact1]
MIDRVKSEKPKRGRPRSEAARRAILDAAAGLLEEGGISAVTMEAVAARAKVGKPTIYRSWPNAQALAMATLMEADTAQTNVRETASPLADLERQLLKVVDKFATKRGGQVRLMLAAAEQDSEIAKGFRNQVILKSRVEGHDLLTRAIVAGEVRVDADIEIALDMIYGPLFYRVLIGHLPLDAAFAQGLLRDVLRGLRSGA